MQASGQGEHDANQVQTQEGGKRAMGTMDDLPSTQSQIPSHMSELSSIGERPPHGTNLTKIAPDDATILDHEDEASSPDTPLMCQDDASPPIDSTLKAPGEQGPEASPSVPLPSSPPSRRHSSSSHPLTIATSLDTNSRAAFAAADRAVVELPPDLALTDIRVARGFKLQAFATVMHD